MRRTGRGLCSPREARTNWCFGDNSMKPIDVVAIWLACLLPLSAQDAAPKPPVAPTKPYKFDFHSLKIDDPYFWLKDKKNPETIRYIEAENAYREAVTKHLKPFEE